MDPNVSPSKALGNVTKLQLAQALYFEGKLDSALNLLEEEYQMYRIRRGSISSSPMDAAMGSSSSHSHPSSLSSTETSSSNNNMTWSEELYVAQVMGWLGLCLCEVRSHDSLNATHHILSESNMFLERMHARYSPADPFLTRTLSSTLHNLASTCISMHKYDEAERLLQKSLRLRGDNEMGLAKGYVHQAVLCEAQGRHDEAWEWCEKSRKIREAKGGKAEGSNWARLLWIESIVLLHKGQYEKGKQVAVECAKVLDATPFCSMWKTDAKQSWDRMYASDPTGEMKTFELDKSLVEGSDGVVATGPFHYAYEASYGADKKKVVAQKHIRRGDIPLDSVYSLYRACLSGVQTFVVPCVGVQINKRGMLTTFYSVAGASLRSMLPSISDRMSVARDIYSALNWLHRVVHLTHLNINPDTIVDGTDGHWKLGSLFTRPMIGGLNDVFIDPRLCKHVLHESLYHEDSQLLTFDQKCECDVFSANQVITLFLELDIDPLSLLPGKGSLDEVSEAPHAAAVVQDPE